MLTYVYSEGEPELAHVYCDECGRRIEPDEDCWLLVEDHKPDIREYFHCLECGGPKDCEHV